MLLEQLGLMQPVHQFSTENQTTLRDIFKLILNRSEPVIVSFPLDGFPWICDQDRSLESTALTIP